MDTTSSRNQLLELSFALLALVTIVGMDVYLVQNVFQPDSLDLNKEVLWATFCMVLGISISAGLLLWSMKILGVPTRSFWKSAGIVVLAGIVLSVVNPGLRKLFDLGIAVATGFVSFTIHAEHWFESSDLT